MTYIKRCPECGSINLTHDEHRGEIICGDCGLIIEDKMGGSIRVQNNGNSTVEFTILVPNAMKGSE